MFMSYKFTVLHGGINADTYELVFDGDLPAQTAEDVFRIFNLKHPNGYRGRSMSVSDIVWMEDIGYWFCDKVGPKLFFFFFFFCFFFKCGAAAAERAANLYLCRCRSRHWMRSAL